MQLEKRRGRPRRAGKKHVIVIKLILWEGEDDDLIALFAYPRTRAQIVKSLARGAELKASQIKAGVTKEEMFQAFDALMEAF